jgi:hypothetical protein
MDSTDRQQFAAAFRALAEVLSRPRPADRPENHLSYALGDLTGRIFLGAEHLPPDELLAQVVEALRSGNPTDQQALAERLREHASLLENVAD